MERDFPKHWKECELGKRTPEEKQNFRRSVKEGSGTRDQMNSALLLSTWDSSWSCGFPGLQGLQPGSMCAFAFQKETRTAGVLSERGATLGREWWGAPGHTLTNNSRLEKLRPHFSHPQLQIIYWPTHQAIPPLHCHSAPLGNTFQDCWA